MILVFGKSGQVARELAGLSPVVFCLSRGDADLLVPKSCVDAIYDLQPSAVINAAAYTSVDGAEAEEAAAMAINGSAPGAIAAACFDLAIPMVQISTDYVFSGSGTSPIPPDARADPLGTYGRSKVVGEMAVRASGAAHVILRTSWVFSAHGQNFVKTMLRLANTRDRIAVVADQVGGPTPASAIARACLVVAEQVRADTRKSGTYHFAGSPDVSWADFAREIFRLAGKDITVEDIPTSAYPTPARRPANSRLECSTLANFGLTRPDWKPALSEVLAELETL